MDKETEAAFAGIMVVLDELTQTMDRRFDATEVRFDAVDRRFEAVEAKLAHMATKAQLVELMKRMNDGFEPMLDSAQTLRKYNNSTQEIIVTLGQRVTRPEQDVRQLRGGI
jgi:hypothetical protein